MALVYALVGIALLVLVTGIRKHDKKLIRNAIIGLAVIAILLIVYQILYSMNPY